MNILVSQGDRSAEVSEFGEIFKVVLRETYCDHETSAEFLYYCDQNKTRRLLADWVGNQVLEILQKPRRSSKNIGGVDDCTLDAESQPS